MAVHVIVTCSKRKKQTAERPIRLSVVRAKSVEERAAKWIARLESAQTAAIPARDLYMGEQWSLLRELEQENPRAGKTKFWILSAGYGLIPFSAPLKAYAATFSRSHPESVFDPIFSLPLGEVVTRWWNALASWEGPTAAPRSLAQLVEADRDSTVLLAASPVYLRAVSHGVEEARSRLRSPDRMLVFSGGSKTTGGRNGSLLKFDGRLQNRLGGSLMTLNVRVLEAVLRQTGPLARATVQRQLDGWMEEAPALKKHDRRAIPDRDVRKFIRDELEKDPRARWTPLLRKLRDTVGAACEQKRFRSLYGDVLKTFDQSIDAERSRV